MLAGENFGKFATNLPSFIRQLLVISEKAIEAGLKFASCLCQMQFSLQFAKVFSRQNFPLYGKTKIPKYYIINAKRIWSLYLVGGLVILVTNILAAMNKNIKLQQVWLYSLFSKNTRYYFFITFILG